MKYQGDATDVTALVRYAQSLEAENDRLRAALRKIANPIGYFQEYAKQEGRQIDGHMVIQISKDPGWLSSEAAKALPPSDQPSPTVQRGTEA
jgi:hypothetical protein